MIRFERVTKRFGRYLALDNLSFEAPAQQAVALWGANGAGKTTAIKCLLGLLHCQGSITIDGIDAQKQGKAARRLVGYVPQELAFYADLRTLEMAQFFANLRGAPARQVAEVLAQVGLAEHTGKAVGALSGGMKQRLALGLALLGDPPVLVLDEPTSNLDSRARDQFLQLLGDVKAAGKTILFTSHRLEEIEALADAVVVMAHGAVQMRCAGVELAERLGLRSTVKLHLPPELLDHALVVLHNDGYHARRNGVGVLVDVRPGEKARPIHTLQAAAITVTDFEME